ncbi:MAG: hypothetical protein GY835_22640 [bacterium]|nr:hypothetical protein [bacterium]
MFILYDGRAHGGNPEDAAVLDTADTEAECLRITREGLHGDHNVWYQYDIKGSMLINERERADLSHPE